MWERDLQSAFRFCPRAVEHANFAWVVWNTAEGKLRCACHKGMPFGAVGSVRAFHRVGEFLMGIVRCGALTPAGRFVDDFSGANSVDSSVSGGLILDTIVKLLGFQNGRRQVFR